MTKIKNISELPEWFNLEKYTEAKNLDAAGWFIQLSARKDLYEFYEDFEKKCQSESEFFSGGETLLAALQLHLDQMRSKPIETDTYDNFYARCRTYGFKEDLTIKPVRPLSFQDLAAQCLWDASTDTGETSQANGWALLKCPETSEYPIEPVPVGIFGDNMLAALVDLNASDSVLKNAFSLWLKEARQSEATALPKQSRLYKSWANYGLLPFLDLRIWSMEKRAHIPGHIMSRAVSGPSFDRGVENLRKTLVPIAISLMRDLSELQALAAIEVAAPSCPYPEISNE